MTRDSSSWIGQTLGLLSVSRTRGRMAQFLIGATRSVERALRRGSGDWGSQLRKCSDISHTPRENSSCNLLTTQCLGWSGQVDLCFAWPRRLSNLLRIQRAQTARIPRSRRSTHVLHTRSRGTDDLKPSNVLIFGFMSKVADLGRVFQFGTTTQDDGDAFVGDQRGIDRRAGDHSADPFLLHSETRISVLEVGAAPLSVTPL